MAELDSVMKRLDDHAKLLRERATPPLAHDPALQDGDKAMLVEGLALMSEAILRVGRDVRFLRLQLADRT